MAQTRVADAHLIVRVLVRDREVVDLVVAVLEVDPADVTVDLEEAQRVEVKEVAVAEVVADERCQHLTLHNS